MLITFILDLKYDFFSSNCLNISSIVSPEFALGSIDGIGSILAHFLYKSDLAVEMGLHYFFDEVGFIADIEIDGLLRHAQFACYVIHSEVLDPIAEKKLVAL